MIFFIFSLLRDGKFTSNRKFRRAGKQIFRDDTTHISKLNSKDTAETIQNTPYAPATSSHECSALAWVKTVKMTLVIVSSNLYWQSFNENPE